MLVRFDRPNRSTSATSSFNSGRGPQIGSAQTTAVLRSQPLAMSSLSAAKAAQASSRVIAVNKKYTLQSVGIWERIRRILAVDPTRSNGIPLNPQFRNPPPGSNEPFSFVDPVTLPAADIADNPYWKRDVRRNYPRLSVVNQGDVVSLLTVGSAAAPKQELIGEAGSKALVAAGEQGQKGVAAFFREKGALSAKDVLDKDGLPPLPATTNFTARGMKYDLTEENAYPEKYPCRTFA